MVAVALAAVSLAQLLLVLVLELSPAMRNLTESVFRQSKARITDIAGLSDDQTDGVLRVTDLVTGLLGSGLNLLVGGLVAIATGIIGNSTHQRPPALVIGAYVAGGVCVAFLIVMLVLIVINQVQDYAKWNTPPKHWLSRAIRNALSPRTPYFYKLIVLVTSICLLVIASRYK
jgi:hypothetical protein